MKIKHTWITTNTIFSTCFCFNSTINLQTNFVYLFNKYFFVTLTKGTGGSFFPKTAAALSNSGASRLPLKSSIS